MDDEQATLITLGFNAVNSCGYFQHFSQTDRNHCSIDF